MDTDTYFYVPFHENYLTGSAKAFLPLRCLRESLVVFVEQLAREMGSGMDPAAGPAGRTGGKLIMRIGC